MAAPTHATTSTAHPAGDDAPVRRAAFWRTLLFAGVVVAAGHAIERVKSYSLGEVPGIAHGSYGISLSRVPPKDDGAFRVLLMGNSVYQRSGVCENFRAFAEAEGRPIEFLNLSQIAANVSDYAVQLGWALGQGAEPDAVLMSFGSFTFSDLGFTFNTSADDVAYDPRVVGFVPDAFYGRHFDNTAIAESVIDVAAPLRRMDTVLQYQANEAVKGLTTSAGVEIGWLTRTLPLPKLNHVANEVGAVTRRGRFHPGQAWLNRPFKDDAAQTFSEVLGMVEASGAAVFLLRQQCKYWPISDDAARLVASELERARAVPIGYVDFEDQWDPDTFLDVIHPAEDQKAAYAREHYDAFIRFLEGEGYGDRIAPRQPPTTPDRDAG